MQKVNIHLKPSLLRGWVITRKTKKCIVVRKVYTKDNWGYKKGELGPETLVPNKTITRIEKVEEIKDG